MRGWYAIHQPPETLFEFLKVTPAPPLPGTPLYEEVEIIFLGGVQITPPITLRPHSSKQSAFHTYYKKNTCFELNEAKV